MRISKTVVHQLLVSLTALAVVSASRGARACTALFAETAEGRLLAKSFDWQTATGYVVANERGRVRQKLVPGGPEEVESWTARYASLSFTTVGPGFPVSGMNEAGLVIEALVDLSQPPVLEPDPEQLTGLELVQHGLDRYDTAEGFGAFAARVGFSQLGVPLHFLACDRGGACVVIETRDDEVVVTRGAALDVHALANRPFSSDRARARASFLGRLFGLGPGGRGSSSGRFATAAIALGQHRPRSTEEAFQLLGEVGLGELTAWQIVWHLGDGSVTWREPRTSREPRGLRLSASVTSCEGAPRVLPLGRAQGATGSFVRWTPAESARVVAVVLEQLQGDGAAARRLAAAIGEAVVSSRCSPPG